MVKILAAMPQEARSPIREESLSTYFYDVKNWQLTKIYFFVAHLVTMTKIVM